MIKFSLKETTIKVRDQDVRIRELTHKERTDYIKNGTEDKFRLPAMLASLGVIDPKMTEEEWQEEPADVLDILSQEVAKMSGLGSKKDAKQKEPDAGSAVSV